MIYNEERHQQNVLKGRDFKTVYTEWEETKHSKTTTPYRPLDHVFTDGSVGKIIMTYLCTDICNKASMYDLLKQPGSFFSPAKDGSYSTIAQSFGFPASSTVNGAQHGGDMDNSDVNSL